MTAMMTPAFAACVHRIQEGDLSDHLSGDYDAFLPDDMACGKVDTNKLVDDFVAYRKHVEKVVEIMPTRPGVERQRSKQRVSFDPAISQ